MKNVKAKFPFGDCVKAKFARQSCRSRWSDTTWLANSWRSTSYDVCQVAAHFSVRRKLVFACTDVTDGSNSVCPPASPEVIGASEGVVRRWRTHSSNTNGMSRNAAHCDSGS